MHTNALPTYILNYVHNTFVCMNVHPQYKHTHIQTRAYCYCFFL